MPSLLLLLWCRAMLAAIIKIPPQMATFQSALLNQGNFFCHCPVRQRKKKMDPALWTLMADDPLNVSSFLTPPLSSPPLGCPVRRFIWHAVNADWSVCFAPHPSDPVHIVIPCACFLIKCFCIALSRFPQILITVIWGMLFSLPCWPDSSAVDLVLYLD